MEKLTGPQLQDFLDHNPDWHADDGALVREYTFPDFRAAMQFINHVADHAEAAGHHPDIDIRYNKVRLALVTHDAGGITANDTSMAMALSQDFGR
jgi:4a-hydroxytetrahydrobiopterin dehydratase